jgi:glycogen phosphorylase
VYLNDLEPDALRVELYAEGLRGTVPERVEMKRLHPLIGTSGGFVFGGAISAVRPPADYTARIIPQCAGVGVPLEYSRIIWQK